jgi:hypothetical protein
VLDTVAFSGITMLVLGGLPRRLGASVDSTVGLGALVLRLRLGASSSTTGAGLGFPV